MPNHILDGLILKFPHTYYHRSLTIKFNTIFVHVLWRWIDVWKDKSGRHDLPIAHVMSITTSPIRIVSITPSTLHGGFFRVIPQHSIGQFLHGDHALNQSFRGRRDIHNWVRRLHGKSVPILFQLFDSIPQHFHDPWRLPVPCVGSFVPKFDHSIPRRHQVLEWFENSLRKVLINHCHQLLSEDRRHGIIDSESDGGNLAQIEATTGSGFSRGRRCHGLIVGATTTARLVRGGGGRGRAGLCGWSGRTTNHPQFGSLIVENCEAVDHRNLLSVGVWSFVGIFRVLVPILGLSLFLLGWHVLLLLLVGNLPHPTVKVLRGVARGESWMGNVGGIVVKGVASRLFCSSSRSRRGGGGVGRVGWWRGGGRSGQLAPQVIQRSDLTSPQRSAHGMLLLCQTMAHQNQGTEQCWGGEVIPHCGVSYWNLEFCLSVVNANKPWRFPISNYDDSCWFSLSVGNLMHGMMRTKECKDVCIKRRTTWDSTAQAKRRPTRTTFATTLVGSWDGRMSYIGNWGPPEPMLRYEWFVAWMLFRGFLPSTDDDDDKFFYAVWFLSNMWHLNYYCCILHHYFFLHSRVPFHLSYPVRVVGRFGPWSSMMIIKLLPNCVLGCECRYTSSCRLSVFILITNFSSSLQLRPPFWMGVNAHVISNNALHTTILSKSKEKLINPPSCHTSSSSINNI